MNALTAAKTFTVDTTVPESWFTDLQTDVRSVARSFWDDGTPDLALSEQKKGTVWVDPTTKRLWYFRIDGAGDPRDAGTPVSGNWLWDDFEGFPPLDPRVQGGDSFLFDTGSGDSYVQHYGAAEGRFWGRGVLAEARTAATSGAPDQASQRLVMRSSRWDTSGTPAAQDREWSFYSHTSPSGGNNYSLLHIDRRHNGGSWTNVATLDTNGWLFLAGPVPGIELNSGGAGRSFFRVYSSDPDLSRVEFGHGGTSKLARFRFAGSTDERDGVSALALSAIYGSAATALATTVKSAALGGTASFWDGAAAQEASWYDQLILTSTAPAGYLRRGFGSWGPGTLDLYSYGRLALAGTTTLTGTLADGDAAQTTLTPTYDGAHTVTRHNYRKLANPTLTNSAVVTDACRDHYDAAAGTHKALDAATGGADAWEKVNEAGTVLYGPLFASKDLGILTPVYGEISLTDGAAAVSMSTMDEWAIVTGYDTDGVSAGVTTDASGAIIAIATAGKYRVTLCASFSGDPETYVWAVIEGDESPSGIAEVGRQARTTLTTGDESCVAVDCLMDLAAENVVAAIVKCTTAGSVGVTISELSLTVERVG